MTRISIPLYYAMPIWAFLATVCVLASIFDAKAWLPKHGGLAFTSLFFGFVSALPTALIAAGQPKAFPRRNEVRRAFCCGVGAVVALVLVCGFGRVLPLGPVSVTSALSVVIVVLLGLPFYLQSRLNGNRKPPK